MQLINVARGGTLLQHLPERFGHHEHRRVVGSFDGADHEVELREGTLATRVGRGSPRTKSHHHQGVDRVGEGLRVSGDLGDGRPPWRPSSGVVSCSSGTRLTREARFSEPWWEARAAQGAVASPRRGRGQPVQCGWSARRVGFQEAALGERRRAIWLVAAP